VSPRRPQPRDPLFRRHPSNPILTARDWPYPCNSVFNPAVARLEDGNTLLLCRVEDHRGQSHLCAVRSRDGVSDWVFDPLCALLPHEDLPEERYGIEDARVTFLPELGQWVVAYTSFGEAGPGLSLALTKDFRTYERIGQELPPENKDAALFPRRIDGRWVMLHRPVSPLSGAHIWIARSPDLRHWGEHRRVLMTRPGGWWDSGKIGLSPPPIETPEGWLILYHGVRYTVSGAIYRLGLALLDRQRPEVCLLRGDEWVFGPEEPYERGGDVENVVFPCGYTLGEDGDKLNLYYGAADTSVCLATASTRELLAWLKESGRPERPSAFGEEHCH
jgi:predicted GH43/DUF377 family glycosyl hydrolase